MAYYQNRKPRRIYIDTHTDDAQSQIESATDTLSVYRQSLIDLFSRSNSILAGQKVECKISPITPVACTDGENIYFNPEVIDKALRGVQSNKLDVKNALWQLAKIRGLNLHELAHIVYSPRKGSVVWNEVTKLHEDISKDPNLYHLLNSLQPFRVWNLLEDQRIESLFATKYRNSIPYFHRTIVDILLDDPQASPKLFHIWLYGRRYLPAVLRSHAREIFISETSITDEDLEEWENIIDEYRSFIFPKDGRKVTPLVLRFMVLWGKYFPNVTMPESGTGGVGTGGHGERRNGSADTQEQKESQERREEVEQDWEDLEEESEDDSEEEGTQSGDHPEDSESEEESEEGDSDSDSDAGKNNRDSDSDSDSDNGSSGGNGVSKNNGEGDALKQSKDGKKLMALLEDSLATNSEQIKEDLAETLKQVLHRAERLKTDILFKHVEKPESTVAPSPKFKAISNALNSALRQLRSDNESTWERGVPTGRLNIGLAMDSEAQDSDIDVFDRWNDSGDDAPRVELVILLDQSGSMATQIPTTQSSGYYDVMTEASASVWAIKLACQQNDIPCTVVGYSDPTQTAILYRADDKVNNLVNVYGHKNYTDPSKALKIAHTIFAGSDATNKILVSISDGEWSIGKEEIDTIGAMNSTGVDSIFVALPCRYNATRTTDSDGKIAFSYQPDFANGLQGNGRNYYDHSKNEWVSFSAFYAHKVGIKVANPSELAKKIGKAVIKASR